MRPHRIEPAPGQESVWDYPRPPRLEASPQRLRVVFNGVVIADTTRGYRVLETSHPPVYYFPPEDVRQEYLRASRRGSFCEWKGAAGYFSVEVDGRRLPDVAWFYAEPTSTFEPIRNYLAFYAGPMDACYVDDEQVTPQPGGFYGGWITSNVVGPFKGEAGTSGW